MASYIDDAIAGAGRMGDDVVASIRRLLGYDTPTPPGSVYTQPPAKGKPGGAVRGAVQANDAARARQAVQARRIGLMDEPADAVNKTFKARDAAGPIVAATGALAGAGLVGSVADKVKKSYDPPPALDSTGGAADLADESRPVPVVEATAGRSTELPPHDPEAEAKFTDTFKRQYTARENKRREQGAGGYPKPAVPPAVPAPDPREQAYAMVEKLNGMYRQGLQPSSPQAQQMKAQINQLFAAADQQRNSRTPQQAQAAAADSPDDPHAQASAMLADLNARARAMGGTPPDMQKTLAEVRRLQALGDERRNSRTTARR